MRRITPAGAGKTSSNQTAPLLCQDHPRRCGENSTMRRDSSLSSGSPPQVRGKLIDECFPATATGITPAGAGKTICHGWEDAKNIGSPPQVRGKLSHNATALFGARITPAGAGKTTKTDAKPLAGQDHPRRCGENYTVSNGREWKTGSPPQVRGKLHQLCYVGFVKRITPAGAGKTASMRSWLSSHKDHPRRCGENKSIGF